MLVQPSGLEASVLLPRKPLSGGEDRQSCMLSEDLFGYFI